jgi:ParB-like chromosome segregation protein Spo0J
MAKMILPKVNLDLTLEAGKMKAITAAATGKGVEYTVKVDQLRPLPGFNVRVRETDDYRSHVEALKQSIRENGFYPNKPLAGYIGKEGEEDVIYVTDGYTRLEAVTEINDEALNDDEQIEGLPVVLKSPDSTLADLTIALVQDNSGRPLTPYEMGVVVQRLAGMKGDGDAPLFSKADIARRLSVTERYIDDLNVLVGAPAKVRDAVLRGNVSSTLAIQELRRDPKKAESRLIAAVEKATASGKTKATRKDVGAVKMQKVRATVSIATGDSIKDVLKSMAKSVRDAVGHDKETDVLTTDGTLTIIMEVPAPTPAPKPAAAKKTAAKKSGSTKKSGKSSAPAAKAATTPSAAKSDASDQSGTNGADSAPEVTSDADEGEPVKLPPAIVSEGGGDDPDDI